MEYELCRQLKEKGFPLAPWRNDVYFRGMRTPFEAIEKATYNDGMLIDINVECVQIPTLARLIAACGNRFSSLGVADNDPDTWMAFSKESFKGGHQGMLGKTPSEAVARLWLELNKVIPTP